jgi:hypothetical protein
MRQQDRERKLALVFHNRIIRMAPVRHYSTLCKNRIGRGAEFYGGELPYYYFAPPVAQSTRNSGYNVSPPQA